MCEPTTIGLMAAGTAAQMYAQQQGGEASAATLRAQAESERAQAADALQRGAGEAGRVRTAGSQLIGENKVALAASGVDVQSGSAVDALTGVRQANEMDVQTVRSNAARAAWGHTSQATLLDAEAENVEEQAKLAMVGTFLGGAAQVGAYKTRKAG